MDVAEALRTIPLLAKFEPGELQVERLAGLTNENYRISGNEVDYILRLPRAETNHWLDRHAERYNLELAINAGLAPGFRYLDDQGVMLSDHLDSSRVIPATYLRDHQQLTAFVDQLKQLHQLPVQFKGQVDLAGLIERYYSMMTPADQQDYRSRYNEFRELTSEPELLGGQALVPSHNDLVLQNLLLQGARLWWIDWEYSSMASPYWDLATLCNEADFDAEQESQLLQLYNQAGDDLHIEVLRHYRKLLALLGDCWLRAFHPSC